MKIYYENVDNEKIELIENNDYYALSFVSKANKDKIVDIKLDLENVTDNYKNRIISLNNNFKVNTNLSLKEFVLPLSKTKKYKKFVLSNSLLKIKNELCK